MNVPVACAHLWTLLKDPAVGAEEKYCAVERADTVLGLDLLKDDRVPNAVAEIEKNGVRLRIVSQTAPQETLVEQIASLMAQRMEARKNKAFDKADSIRKELSGMGVEIKDLPGGVAECRVGVQ